MDRPPPIYESTLPLLRRTGRRHCACGRFGGRGVPRNQKGRLRGDSPERLSFVVAVGVGQAAGCSGAAAWTMARIPPTWPEVPNWPTCSHRHSHDRRLVVVGRVARPAMLHGRLRVRQPFHKRAIPARSRAVARRPVFRACNRATTLLRYQRAAAVIAHGFWHEIVRWCLPPRRCSSNCRPACGRHVRAWLWSPV